MKISVGELIEDLDVYPRSQVDSTHVGHIADAIEAGATMPQIIADEKSKRITDGFHRARAYKRLFGPDHKVDVLLKNYKNEAELFADAVRMNSAHGNNITTYDRVRCMIIGERLGIKDADLCSALNITVEKMGELRVARIGNGRRAKTPDGDDVPLKSVVSHMAGQSLTKDQVNIMPDLGGNQQAFYANQLIKLIDTRLIDSGNAKLMERLVVLNEKLNEFLK